jgi:vacuolar-type H+-ATPase subunit E/Vma4
MLVIFGSDQSFSVCCSEYSKQLNEQRIKVLSARETAIQEIVTEAKLKLREVSKNPSTYKKLLTDLLVQVSCLILADKTGWKVSRQQGLTCKPCMQHRP